MTLQEAYEKAVKTNSLVMFRSKMSNDEIRKVIVNMKECTFTKKEEDSDLITVMPVSWGVWQ